LHPLGNIHDPGSDSFGEKCWFERSNRQETFRQWFWLRPIFFGKSLTQGSVKSVKRPFPIAALMARDIFPLDPIADDSSRRLFEAEGDAASGLPKIRVAYRVLGDKLDFKMLAVLDP
jgi:hypothetical protein